MDYLRGQHLLLSLLLSFVFVILPFFLLALYPFRCFHRFLNLLKLRCQALHILVDVFQGSYKLEPHDLRIFSAFHLLVRFLLLLLFVQFHTSFVVSAAAFLLLLASLFFALFRPYKNEFHNTLDVISIGLLALVYMSFSFSISTHALDAYWGDTSYGLLGVAIILIFVYAIVNMTFSGIRNLLRYIVSKIKLRVNERAAPTNDSISARCETTDGQNPQDSPNERSLLIESVLDR